MCNPGKQLGQVVRSLSVEYYPLQLSLWFVMKKRLVTHFEIQEQIK